MKTYILILFLIVFTSCRKTDKINHYLNKPITESELVNNGFYKYTNTFTTEDDLDDAEDDSFAGKTFRQVLYTNVKPQKQKDGKSYPVPLFKYNENLDKIQFEERLLYINDLDDRIISYFFINDTLKYKSIYVYSIDKNKKHIPDFRTKENIIKYYDSLKISIKPIIDGKKSTIKHPTLFMIDNYKTRIYFERYPGVTCDMLTNYVDNDMPYWDIMNQWYSGGTYELSK